MVGYAGIVRRAVAKTSRSAIGRVGRGSTPDESAPARATAASAASAVWARYYAL